MIHTIPSTAWGNGYIAGLVVGEGNFTIAISKVLSCRLGYHVRPIFQIELSRVDEPLLRSVQTFFGFGSINFPKPRKRVKLESPTVRYTVTAIRECGVLESFFSKNPLIGAKAQAFAQWSKCLSVIREGRHTATEGFREIISLRDSINQIRRPSTFRNEYLLKTTASCVVEGRNIKTWTDAETQLVNDFIEGQMTRQSLITTLGRPTASVAAKITRIRSQKKK